jgi:hypothetical protein
MGLGVMLGRLVSRVHRLSGVTVGGVSVMGGLFVFAALVVLSRLVVVLGGVLVVRGGFRVMLGPFMGVFRHRKFSWLAGPRRHGSRQALRRKIGACRRRPDDGAPFHEGRPEPVARSPTCA